MGQHMVRTGVERVERQGLWNVASARSIASSAAGVAPETAQPR
jgi:hypothetical protein